MPSAPRYDSDYIGECVKVLRETAKEDEFEPIPIFGNGDAYDWRTYHENLEATQADGIAIARGALIKPWIFTEVREGIQAPLSCGSTVLNPSCWGFFDDYRSRSAVIGISVRPSDSR